MQDNQRTLDPTEMLERENDLLKAQNHKLLGMLEEQERRHHDLENRLSIDAKTGLPNHSRLAIDLGEIIKRVLRKGKPGGIALAIVLIRLDDKYNLLSKTMKPSVSEWVLYQTGQRLIESLSSKDSLYHTREDEFAILFTECESKKDLQQRVTKTVAALGKPHVFSGYHVTIGSSAGIAIFPDHGVEKGKLLHAADIALEDAHQSKKAVRVFSETMRETVVERMELQNAIIKALEVQAIEEISRQFKVYLQPIVSMRAIEGQHVVVENVDAEVLIRWEHPTKGLLSPDKFIPVAEETGLILPIGNWVLFQAAEMLGRWSKKAGGPSLSVNISPKQFVNDQFVENVIRMVQQRAYLKGKIRLELTESCLMDDPMHAISRMHRLAGEDISFSVDDFGTGYSSLSYLSKLPVHSLKIDKSFVHGMSRSRQDNAIVKTIIALGNEMGFDVVCEGVETTEELVAISKHGCHTIQGFIFGKPVPEKDFLHLRERLMRGPIGFDELKAGIGP